MLYRACLLIIMTICVAYPHNAVAQGVSADKKSIPRLPAQFILGKSANFKGGATLNASVVEVAVARDGRFTLGDDKGNNLLYGHPSPSTSFTTVRIDNRDFPNRNSNSWVVSVAPPTMQNDVYTGRWLINGNIEIVQTLSLVSGSDGPQSNCEIRYTLINRDTRAHTVGLRLLLDTQLGSNDGAPFRVPGVGDVTTDREWLRPNIPPFFEAFDNLQAPRVFSIGTLIGDNAIIPDRLVATGWSQSVNTTWDYRISSGQDFTNDSAILLYWDPVTLQPGESREIVTYYGSGRAEVDRLPPIATRIAFPQSMILFNGTAQNNPFALNVYLSNTISGVNVAARNTQTILRIPDGLEIANNASLTQIVGDIPVRAERQVTYFVTVKPTTTGRQDFFLDISLGTGERKTMEAGIYVFNITTSPTAGGTIAVGASNVTARFGGAMNASSINERTFLIFNPDGTQVTGTVSYNASNNTATFTPSGTSRFQNGIRYRARLSSTILAADGRALGANTEWTFVASNTVTSSLVLNVSPETEQIAAPGQTVRYTLTVRDVNNQPVADATIGVEDNVLMQSRAITTNSAGQAEYALTVPTSAAQGTSSITFRASKQGIMGNAVVTRTVRVGASSQLSSIFGKVTTPDANGAANTGVANVIVRLKNGAETRTDAQGNYAFRNLQAGRYTVIVDYPNGYRMVGLSKQGVTTDPASNREQNFIILPLVNTTTDDKTFLIALHITEREFANNVKYIEMGGYSDNKLNCNNIGFTLNTIPVNNKMAFVSKSFLSEGLSANTQVCFAIKPWAGVTDIHLLDAEKRCIGKIGFQYTLQDLRNNRFKETIIILHNNLVSYQKHPIEKAGTPAPDGNSEWAFANYYGYPYLSASNKDDWYDLHKKITNDLFQTTMLIPPADQEGNYALENTFETMKPVLWIHGVTGTDGYWGTNDETHNYPFTSYPGRFQQLDWAKRNCDSWQYFYPPDQSWEESGYLFSEDLNTLKSYYDGNKKITLIAHSMGGLVARSYIEETATNYTNSGQIILPKPYLSEIDKILFLGTPQHGSFGGTKIYWEIFLAESLQTSASGKDSHAPANRELGIGSQSLTKLNAKPLDTKGVQYLQLSGTTWKGLIPNISNDVLVESRYHEDGIVSVSSGSLLNFGIPLGIIRGFSHAHLSSPDNEDYDLSPSEKNYIPQLVQEYIEKGHINSFITDERIFTKYINSSTQNLWAKTEFPPLQSREEKFRADIGLPMVSFRILNSLDNWSLSNRNVNFILNTNNRKPALTFVENINGRTNYQECGLFLMYSGNNFANDIDQNSFKRSNTQNPPRFYGYEYYSSFCNSIINNLGNGDNIESHGVGWHIPNQSQMQLNNILLEINNSGPNPNTRGWTPSTQLGSIQGSINLQWCTTTYSDLYITPHQRWMLDGSQGLPPSQSGQRFLAAKAEATIQSSEISPFTVDCAMQAASFHLTYGLNPEPSMEIIRPDGRVITASMANDRDIFYTRDTSVGIKYFTVTKPLAGQWTVRVNNRTTLPDTSYRIAYFSNSPFRFTVNASRRTMMTGSTATITAQLAGAGNDITNRRVWASYRNASNQEVSIAMNDNGLNGDTRANDGVFAGSFKEEIAGTYRISLESIASNSTCAITRFGLLDIVVQSSQVAIAAPTGFRLLNPPNNAGNISPASITFRWASALPSVYYNFQIATDPLFIHPLLNEHYTDTTKMITGFSLNRWYYWRVRPLGGEWSPVWSFYTGTLPAQTASLSNAIVQGQPTSGQNTSEQLSSQAPSNIRSVHETNTGEYLNVLTLRQYPNPFSSTTTLEYLLPRDAHVRMDICNTLGQTILTPVNSMEQGGLHSVSVVMDKFPSAVYVVRLNVGGQVLTRQMTLIR
jgi:pimeloyl-ACP methyl ester carboxylesterase